MRLVLFDIDGTILKVDRGLTHRIVLDVINEVLQREEEFIIPETYRFHGRTDRMIFLDLCEHLGESREITSALIPAFELSLMQQWTRHLNEKTVALLPGIVELLQMLHNDENVTLGLLTGNLIGGARAKLEPHRMNHFFPFGAFGSDAIDRNELPPIALQRANELNGNRFSYDHTVIIGDSHRDIECARAWGIRSVGVATGGLSVEELGEHNPDLLLETLEEIESLVRFIHT